MKKVKIQRAWSDSRATLGMLTIEGVFHNPFFILENPLRDTKVDSRIPAGTYTCKPYSGTKYKDVYILENVPDRSAILMHWGNFEKDTEGCILIGESAGMMQNQPAIMNSKVAFKMFSDLIGKNPFTLEIKD